MNAFQNKLVHLIKTFCAHSLFEYTSSVFPCNELVCPAGVSFIETGVGLQSEGCRIVPLFLQHNLYSVQVTFVTQLDIYYSAVINV